MPEVTHDAPDILADPKWKTTLIGKGIPKLDAPEKAAGLADGPPPILSMMTVYCTVPPGATLVGVTLLVCLSSG